MGYLEKLPKYLYLNFGPASCGVKVEYQLFISPQANQLGYANGNCHFISTGQIGTYEELAEQLYHLLEKEDLLKYGSNEWIEKAVRTDETYKITQAVMEDVNAALQAVVKKGRTKADKEKRDKFYREFWEEYDNVKLTDEDNDN